MSNRRPARAARPSKVKRATTKRRARGPVDANGLPLAPHPRQVALPLGARADRKRYPTTEGIALLAKVMTEKNLTASRVDELIGKVRYTHSLLNRTRKAPYVETQLLYETKLGIPASSWGKPYDGPPVTFPQYTRA